MTILPTGSTDRKAVPIYSGVIAYFPLAIAAVAELSRIGNEQHGNGTPMNWDRSKSGDEKDALMRHLLEAGTVDVDGVRHSTKVAWRALANLEKELEENTVETTTITVPHENPDTFQQIPGEPELRIVSRGQLIFNGKVTPEIQALLDEVNAEVWTEPDVEATSPYEDTQPLSVNDDKELEGQDDRAFKSLDEWDEWCAIWVEPDVEATSPYEDTQPLSVNDDSSDAGEVKWKEASRKATDLLDRIGRLLGASSEPEPGRDDTDVEYRFVNEDGFPIGLGDESGDW